MAALTALEHYGRLLRALDHEAENVSSDEEYRELLSPGEVDELLLARDEVSKASLDASQHSELKQLDDLLVKHHQIIVEWMPDRKHEPRSHWWWYLDEGPQVREQAKAAAKKAG